MVLAVQAGSGKVAKVLDGSRDLDGQRLLDRLALVPGLGLGKLDETLLEEVCQPVQQLGPVFPARRGPARQGLAGRLDGCVDVDGLRVRHQVEHRACRRIEALEVAPVGRCCKGPVNVI